VLARLRLTLGVRYAWEERKLTRRYKKQEDPFGQTNELDAEFGEDAYPDSPDFSLSQWSQFSHQEPGTSVAPAIQSSTEAGRSSFIEPSP